jgi:hypothetical protein
MKASDLKNPKYDAALAHLKEIGVSLEELLGYAAIQSVEGELSFDSGCFDSAEAAIHAFAEEAAYNASAFLADISAEEG